MICFFFLFNEGLLTEVNLPIDSLTKKVKGFAFITFMIPEHAVKAFTELDGTVFQVRHRSIKRLCFVTVNICSLFHISQFNCVKI